MQRQERMMCEHVLLGPVNGEQGASPLQVELDVSAGRQLFGGELERSMGVFVGKSCRDQSDCGCAREMKIRRRVCYVSKLRNIRKYSVIRSEVS